MNKSGTSFELLTAELFERLLGNKECETVEHNVLLDSPDGPRQIDVLLKGRVGPISMMSVIECKDHNKVVTVTEVDALHSKMLDVKANKAILVARRGFSGTAIKKARRLGITLCTAQEALSEKWPFQFEAPFVIEELSCEKIQVSFEFVAIENMQGLVLDRFGDISLAELIAEHWNGTDIECKENLTVHEFEPQLTGPLRSQTNDGREFPIENLKLRMEIVRRFYFGYLNVVESARCLEFVDTKKRHIVFDPSKLGRYRERLVRYSNRGEIPNIAGALILKVKVLHNPQTTFKT